MFKYLRQSVGLFTHVFITAVCLCGAGGVAMALTPAVLTDAELRQEPISLHSLSDGVVSYFDADRRFRVEPVERFIQLKMTPAQPQDEQTPEPPPGEVRFEERPYSLLELVDGQRLIGRWAGTQDDQTMLWHHPVLGELPVSLERVHAMWVSQEDHAADGGAASATDTVSLVNGDRVAGFVVRVTPSVVEVQPEGMPKPVALPIKQVRALRLANPSEPRVDLPMVWLSDGSGVLANSIEVASDQLTLRLVPTTGQASVVLPLDAVDKIDLASEQGYLVDLADLPMRVVAGGDVFGMPVTPQYHGKTVDMHAPTTVAFTLPEGASRVAANARIAVSDSAASQAHAWADFYVIVRINGREQSRLHLHAQQPSASFNVPLEAGELTIELDPAANGPVMDRLRLADAVVLVRRGSPAEPDQR